MSETLTRPNAIEKMSQLPVFTAFTLPGVSAVPAVDCVQWTTDGQVVVLTKYAVYILTPDIGINVEPTAVIKRTPDVEHMPNGFRPIGWARTMIEYDKTLLHHWPADCQDWGAVSLGSLNPTLRSAAPSPSGINSSTASVIAVLNSNMELTIWGPVKNHLQGEWAKLRDMTVELRDAESDPTLVKVLQAQITCMGWSPQADFCLAPALSLDASFLAAGSRAGSVTFYRLREGYEFCLVAVSHVGDGWINHLAWSSWGASKPGTCQAFVACGSPDGSVNIINVIQTLESSSSAASFDVDYDLKESIEVQPDAVCQPDGRNITGMKWVNVTGRSPILAYCKPGVLHLWSSPSPAGGWSGLRAINLRTQKISVASSAFYPPAGLSYIAQRDALLVCLSDGSFHVVHQLSVEPSLDAISYDDSLTSGEISAAARTAFRNAEPEPPLSRDVNRISGFASYDNSATYMWIHEACRPTDFSYKHEAKHVSMFVVAQLWNGLSDDEVLQEITERIIGAKAACREGPTTLLRSTFFHLLSPQRLSRLQKGILDLLQRTESLESPVQMVITPYTTKSTPRMRQNFGRSLSTHLFGWDALFRQRLRLNIAAFCQEISEEPQVKLMFAQAADHFSAAIWHHVLLTIIRHIGSILTLTTVHDAAFVHRVIAQASQPGSPSDLVEEARDLLANMTHAQSDVSPSSDESLDELCPACHAPVALQNTTNAVCPNGHRWTRCCVTSFILSTPMVRTCVGCGRKAFLPLSQTTANQVWLPEPVRTGWIVQDLLEATKRCPFCANNFVAVL